MDRTEGNSPEFKPLSGESLSAESLSAEARQTEQQLRQFQPAPLTLDRDRLMFLAGQAAAHSAIHLPQQRAALVSERLVPAWLWPASTAGMTALAACLAIALALQSGLRQPAPTEIVHDDVPLHDLQGAPQQSASPQQIAPPLAPLPETRPDPAQVAVAQPDARRASMPASIALPAGSVLRMRNVALSFGVDALPQTAPTQASRLGPPSNGSTWSGLPLTEGL
jgi:hypothetical protein